MKRFRLVLFLFTLLLWGCSTSAGSNTNNVNNETNYPRLKIDNINYNYGVRSVKLLGYTFSPILINTGESQTFILDNGMSGGYENIVVSVSDGVHQPSTIRCNFQNGSTTTIKVKKSNVDAMILE